MLACGFFFPEPYWLAAFYVSLVHCDLKALSGFASLFGLYLILQWKNHHLLIVLRVLPSTVRPVVLNDFWRTRGGDFSVRLRGENRTWLFQLSSWTMWLSFDNKTDELWGNTLSGILRVLWRHCYCTATYPGPQKLRTKTSKDTVLYMLHYVYNRWSTKCKHALRVNSLMIHSHRVNHFVVTTHWWC